MNNLQIEMALAATILLIIIIICLKRNSMSIKNSVAWLLLPIAFILIAILPDPFTDLAHWLGFETLANFIFLITIALLIVLCFALTLSISQQQIKITKLIQEISILKEANARNKKR